MLIDILTKEPSKPLYSFEHNSDYVYDVQWSPVNPALFACVDGTGRLDLWNLINDSEVPTASFLIDGAPALNKIRWTQNGLQIAVGDDQGKISLFDVNESYAYPRPDDWQKLVRVLQDLKNSSTEREESSTNTNVQNTPLNSAAITSQTNSAIQQLTPIVASGLTSVKSEPSFDHRVSSSYVSPPSITHSLFSHETTATDTTNQQIN